MICTVLSKILYRSQEVRHTAAHYTWQGCQSVGVGLGGGGGIAPPEFWRGEVG